MKTPLQRCRSLTLQVAAALTCLLALTLAARAADPWQDNEAILAAAERVALERFSDTDGQVSVRADALDPRLRLPACETALTGELPEATREAGRVTAEVSCPGVRPWRLFVPVRVSVQKPVVVATVPVERGKVLAAGDVILAQRAVSSAPAGYLGSVEAAVGQVLRRNVPAGAVLSPGLLNAPVLIERGRHVTLEARSGGIVVQMAGIAKADGALGETIPVQKLSSRKVLQGIGRNEKSVEVLVP